MKDVFTVPIYDPFPITVSRGKGIYLWDREGKRYVDTFSGIGVLAFGHSDEDVISSMKRKMDGYTHLSNFFLDPDAAEVAERLVERADGKGKVYFGNSGAEANEAALKAVKKREGKIVSFVGNFHGRTTGALSVTGFERLRNPFRPLLEDVVFLPFGNAEAFEGYMAENGEGVSAVFLETILGSGGLRTITKEFADSVIESRKMYGFTLVVDEVQSGIGRTGKFYAYQHFEGLEPDIVTLAKSIGGGLPLSATVFTGKGSEPFERGDHGSTFAPNPVALAGAKAVLSKMDDGFMESVREKGEYLKGKINSLHSPKVKEVRGMGLMIGIELLTGSPSDILKEGLKNDLLLNVVGGTTVRFLPALNVTVDEMDEIVSRFAKTLDGIGK